MDSAASAESREVAKLPCRRCRMRRTVDGNIVTLTCVVCGTATTFEAMTGRSAAPPREKDEAVQELADQLRLVFNADTKSKDK